MAVTGVAKVKVGGREGVSCPALCIPNVALNGATLEIVEGVALFSLPPKNKQPWSIAPDAWVYVQGDCALAEETVAGVLDWTKRTGELHLGARDPIPKGVTLRMGPRGRVVSYPTAPWLTVSEAGAVYCDWASRGGAKECVVACDIELPAESTLSVQLRSQTFNGGWQVVSLRTDDAFQFHGIGYGASFSPATRDGGGQNYAEILVFRDALTDVERKDVERHLARKWRIATYVDTEPAPRVSMTGSGHVRVVGDVTIDAAGFSGQCELHDNAHVSFPAAADVVVSGCGIVSALAQRGVPKAFAPTFRGVLRLDFETLAFDVDTRLTAAVNALHVEPARIDVDHPMSLAVRQVGHGDQMLVDLVTAGGFRTEPHWALVSSEGFVRKPKLDETDSNAVRLKVPFPGLTVIVR